MFNMKLDSKCKYTLNKKEKAYDDDVVIALRLISTVEMSMWRVYYCENRLFCWLKKWLMVPIPLFKIEKNIKKILEIQVFRKSEATIPQSISFWCCRA